MKHAALMLLLGIPTLIALLTVYALTRNYARSETRGTVPLERLASRGSELERSVAKAVADSLEARPHTRGGEWYARRRTSVNGDTIFFRIYRAQDARFIGRMLNPDPWIAGGAIYVVSERRYKALGIGVR